MNVKRRCKCGAELYDDETCYNHESGPLRDAWRMR